MALFGRGSFIDVRTNHPDAYGAYDDQGNDGATCIDFIPLGRLSGLNSEASCIFNSQYGHGNDDMTYTVGNWLGLFIADNDTLSRTFTSAAYLANQQWLNHNIPEPFSGTLQVTYDLGEDTEVPVISHARIIAVSAVMGMFFFILFSLVAYTIWTPTWTTRLDAFTMLRMGAAIPDRLPLWIGKRQSAVSALNEIPGWVGDATGEGERVARLGLGADSALDKQRRYLCYLSDFEYMSETERMRSQEAAGFEYI